MSGRGGVRVAAPAAPTASVGGVLLRKCACGSGKSAQEQPCDSCRTRGVQRKLAIGATNDPLELEADRAADHVVAMHTDAAVSSAAPRIQRRAPRADVGADAAPASVERVLSMAGTPLRPALRGEMETRFGADFSSVRIHEDADAAESARDVNALAYTVRNHIVFGAHAFAPGTANGRRLLAHELAHVMQQGASSPGVIRRQPGPDTKSKDETPARLFAADPSRRRDRRFAKKLGEEDAARLMATDSFTAADRSTFDAKLEFFQGDAKDVYIRAVKPALTLATRKPIEMKLMYLGDLADIEPARRDFVRQRREYTFRQFAKYRDESLQQAYESKLQRYLDEGLEENKYWDFEAIEQVIDERAPKAPWHAAARQEFLAKRAVLQKSAAREKSLSKLSAYWQNQFGALGNEVESLQDDLKPFARELLWQWRERVASYDGNEFLADTNGPVAGEQVVFDAIMKRFDADLHARNDAVQKECKANPPGRLMKMWGDPCKSWYDDAGKAEQEYNQLQRMMRIRYDRERLPYRDVFYLLLEYQRARNALPTSMAGRHLEILQTVATVQGSIALGAHVSQPVAIPSAALMAEATLSEARQAAGAAHEVESGARNATRAQVEPPTAPKAPPIEPPTTKPVEPPATPKAAEPAPAVADKPPQTPNKPAVPPRSPGQPPARAGFVNRQLQKLYLALAMTVDEIVPEHRDIAGGRLGNKPTPALIEKAPATAPAANTPRAPAAPVAPAVPGVEVKPAATVATPAAQARAPAAPVTAPTAPVATGAASTVAAAHTATNVATPTNVAPAQAPTRVAAPATNPQAATVANPQSREVYANLTSGVYHLPGTHIYRTGVANGAFMSLAAALQAGYRQAGTPAVAPPSGVYNVETRPDGIVIQAWIGQREARAGFEKELPSAAQYAIAAIAAWERAHSTGAGLGIESERAIRLASRLVNQILQNKGIEQFLRDLRDHAGAATRLHLTTVTETHPRTLRLKSIHYVIEFTEGDRKITAFEAVIEMREDGSARAGVKLSGNNYVFGPWFAQ